MWKRAQNAVRERLTRNWTPHAVPNRSASPIVSLSFDDFPSSAAQAGLRVLRDLGVKATYFASGGRSGKHLDEVDHFTEDDLLSVVAAGHEIGCHTYGHLRVPLTPRAELLADLAKNAEFITRHLGNYKLSTFAYPYGEVSIASKSLMGRLFPNCRGIWSGVNKGRIDFAQLRAVPLDASLDPARVPSLLDETQRSNGWLIFFTHDVSETPRAYGCTPRQLARVMEDVLDRGIEILPMRNAADRIRSGVPSTVFGAEVPASV